MMEFDWALTEELGSRVVADMMVENSRVLGLAAVRRRAFAAEGMKVTAFDKLKGLYIGLFEDDEPDVKDYEQTEADAKKYAEDLAEWTREKERVYEVESVLESGKLMVKLIWPEDKKVDPKTGSRWVIRPDGVEWVYSTEETTPDPDAAWRKQWDALQQSTFARFSSNDES